MNRLQIFNILRPIIASVTGVSEVIMADQVSATGSGLPSPSGEYITVEPKQSVSQRGQANVYRKNSATPRSVDTEVRAQVIVEVSVNVFRGVDAISRLERLIECNKRPLVSAALRAGKLGWQRTTVPNNLTGLQSGNPEQRAQMYIYLYYETTDAETINNIESSTWSVQYETDPIVLTGGTEAT
jgi:hypothetical protein